MTKLPYKEWYAAVMKLKAQLETTPDDLELAQCFWTAISGDAGYDVRDGKRILDTFRTCAMTSDDGLAAMLSAFRKLADDTGEIPRASLFDPPLENLLRVVASRTNHRLSDDARWVLSHVTADD